MMLHPTINELTKGQFNRYELAIATAKCARIITNKYVSQRDKAEKEAAAGKESDKPLNQLIDRELRDEKAVKVAVSHLSAGDYVIVKHEVEEDLPEKHIAFMDDTTLTAPIVIQDDEQDDEEKSKFRFDDNGEDGEEEI